MSVAEERSIGALLQTVRAAVLLVRPPGGRVSQRGEIVVEDRLVADRRPQDPIASLAEDIEQQLEIVAL